MKSVFLYFWLSGFLAINLAGCGKSPAPAANANQPKVSAQRPRFDPAAIEQAKRAIGAEAAVRDLTFDESRPGVEWQVGVLPDGSPRYGFAEYICSVLAERNLIDIDVDVRVVDIARVARGDDFRTASLGQVNCSTRQRQAT